MPKQTIAIDIDDVLSQNARHFVAYSNKKFGLNLTIDDYDEHWAKMWQVSNEETERRAAEFHKSETIREYEHFAEALPVLKKLAKAYKLIIITSRRRETEEITAQWIQTKFPGIITDIHHAGIWDVISDKSITMTKASLARRLQSDYLIDDQLKHCLAAADVGIKAILFGDYAWNQANELPANVTRCATWLDVLEYFDAQG